MPRTPSSSRKCEKFRKINQVVIHESCTKNIPLFWGAHYIADLLKVNVIVENEIKPEENSIVFCSSCSASGPGIRTCGEFNSLSAELTPGRPVIVSLSDRYAELAASYAALRGRTLIFVSEIKEAEPFMPAPSLCVVADPHSLNSTVIRDIFELVGFRADSLYQKVPFGILTAVTGEELAQFMGRITGHHPVRKEKIQSVIALPEEDRPLKTTMNRTVVLNREETTVKRMKEELSKHPHIFVHYGHGNADALLFSDGAFCSIEEVRKVKTPSKMLPHCYSNNYTCLFCEKVEGVPDLSGTVVFSDSCNTIKFEDSFYPMRCNLWQQFISQGALGYLSTYKIKHGEVAEAALGFQLLYNGYTLGETAQILNNVLGSARMDYPSYILIGDPELTIGDGTPAAREIKPDEPIENLNVQFSELSLDMPFFCNRSSMQLAVSNLKPRVKHIYFGIVPDFEKNTTRLFLCSFQDRILKEAALVCEVGALQHEVEHAWITQNLKHVSEYELFFIKDRKLNFLFQELEALSKNMARRHARSLEVNTYPLLRKSVASIRGVIDNIEELVLQTMKTKFHFYEEYKYNFRTERFGVYETCPYCKSPVFSRTIVHISHGDVRRTVKECLRCGTIYDLSGDGTGNVFEIVGETTITTPGFSQVLHYSNMLPRSVHIFAGIYIPAPLPQFTVSPLFYREILDPGGIRDFMFTFTPRDHTIQERYDLNALIIQDAEIYHGLKLVAYCPPGG